LKCRKCRSCEIQRFQWIRRKYANYAFYRSTRKCFRFAKRISPAVEVSLGCLRGFRSVRMAIVAETRHIVANTVIQASVSLLSFWDHMISASHAAAHLPERFRKIYNPDLAYQEQPQGPLLAFTYINKR